MSKFNTNLKLDFNTVGGNYEPDFTPIPDGVYDTKCTAVTLNDQGWMKFTFKILFVDQKDKQLFHNTNPFQFDVARRMFRTHFLMAGFTDAELGEIGNNLGELLMSIVDTNVKVRVKLTEKERDGQLKKYSNITMFDKASDQFKNPDNLLQLFRNKEKAVEKAVDKEESKSFDELRI